MTQQQEKIQIWIIYLIKNDNIHAFYVSKQWLKLKAQILKEQHYECQICKAKGKVSKATTVHHNKFVRLFPYLALSKLDDEGRRNLIAVCFNCHEEIHRRKKPKGFMNEERW